MTSFKEKCKIFYMTKGHLNASKETITNCYDAYFKRAWYNEEFSCVGKDEGFENAYEEMNNEYMGKLKK